MAFPVILYKNLCRNTGAVLTASSTDTGYSINDMCDYRPWKVWQSGTLVTGITIDIDLGGDTGSADTIGLVNHNITSEGGTIELRADTSAGPNPPTTVRQAAYTPTYGDVDLKTFSTASNLRRWRLVLAKGGNFTNKPYLGEVFIGLRTTLPEYLDPATDPYMKGVEAASTLSEGGQYLGSILRGRTHRFDLAFSTVGALRSFHQSDLDTFVDGHVDLLRPFIFQLDSADSVWSKPLYLKRTQDGMVKRPAINGVWSRLGFSIPVEEAWSETP